MPSVRVEKQGPVATVILSRPEVRNAISAEMLCRLSDAWQDVNDDPGSDAMIPPWTRPG